MKKNEGKMKSIKGKIHVVIEKSKPSNRIKNIIKKITKESREDIEKNFFNQF